MSFSWETRSAASPTAQAAPVTTLTGDAWGWGTRARALAVRAPRPELIGVMALAAVLNLWALSRNGWANDYYAAAVRSMSTSWHDFLFASLDRTGVMTVDKPPLALWAQALSVRVFGFHSLSILVPQALMGVVSVALVYDLVRRRFGRVGGAVAGLVLALTPISVAVSRHNNPDALLVLCCVAALWCTVRALDGRRTRWLVAAGVCVGLGFETKMGVALTVLPGIAAAWLWSDPAAHVRERLRSVGQLLAGGGAMVLVGGAWPALVELTPAAQRPWVSGTSDNRVLSLIFEYNGLGRVDGQTGGPGGGGGNMFGGTTGPLRLLNSALGGQASWLLGFALVSAVGLAVATRGRRADARTGWLVAVGGALVTTGVLFSAASGIFHPYYVSLLAPFAAALVGAGAAQLLSGTAHARVFAPLAVAGGVASELVVLGDYPGQLSWLAPVLIAVGCLAALALAAFAWRAVRMAAMGAALAVLLVAPAAWAFDTLGHATSGTFPQGGPVSVAAGGFGGFGGGPLAGGVRGGGAERGGGVPGGGAPGGSGSGGVAPGGPPGARPGEGQTGLGAGGSAAGTVGTGQPLFGRGRLGARAGGANGFAGGFGGGGAIGGPMGGGVSLDRYVAYVKTHGGGTIAVSSQSSAASAILDEGANVAGIGGFSGRESDVSVSWLAAEVRSGKISWVLDEETAVAGGSRGALASSGSRASRGGLPGDTRTGARTAMAAVAKACEKVSVPGSSSAKAGTLYDCAGRAGAIASAGARESSS